MKISIGGEEFEFDPVRRMMSEALAIEKASGRRYVEWENELFAGSAEAACVLAWFIWHREGRDTELKDILSGEVDLDFSEIYKSTVRGYLQVQAEAEAEKENPTSGAEPRTAPDGTAMTPSATKASSPKS